MLPPFLPVALAAALRLRSARSAVCPQALSAYLNSSHLSLLLGRKGAASSMQLKHQRTADVIFAPALPPGQCPDEARVMLETLLPPCGGAPRLLEVSLAPGPQEAASRPGWVKVVQAV